MSTRNIVLAATLAASLAGCVDRGDWKAAPRLERSEEHTSELQSPCNLVCRLLLEKKKTEPSDVPQPARPPPVRPPCARGARRCPKRARGATRSSPHDVHPARRYSAPGDPMECVG